MSNVALMWKIPSLLEWKWTRIDLVTRGFILLLHLACLPMSFPFTWKVYGVFALLYFVTGCLGITLLYHINLSHKSFKFSISIAAIVMTLSSWATIHRLRELYHSAINILIRMFWNWSKLRLGKVTSPYVLHFVSSMIAPHDFHSPFSLMLLHFDATT